MRDQADQFAVMNAHPIALGFTTDGFHHERNGSLTVVGQVHRHLGTPLDEQTQRLDIAQAARRVTDGFGNFLGNLDIVACEIDVVGNQVIARSDNRGPGRA